MIILGVYPGFGITGYGLISADPEDVRNVNLLEAGVLKSPKNLPFSERLGEIYSRMIELLEEFRPASMAVEDIYSVQAFPRSSIAIGHVRGVVLLAASQKKIPVFSYFPRQVKKALVGSGNATKSQVQRMVGSTFALDETSRPDDLTDAIAIALCHASHSRAVDSGWWMVDGGWQSKANAVACYSPSTIHKQVGLK